MTIEQNSFIEIINNKDYSFFEVKAFLFRKSKTQNWNIKFLQTILHHGSMDNKKILSDETKGNEFQLLHREYHISGFKKFFEQSSNRKIDYDGIKAIFTTPYPKETFNPSIIFRHSIEGQFGIRNAHYRLIITGPSSEIPHTAINELISYYSKEKIISAPQILTNFFGFAFGPEGFNFGFDDFMVFLAADE